MSRARKICNQPGCPQLQPCPTHRKIAWATSNRKTRLPHSRAWERTRQAVLNRDPFCQLQIICTGAISTEVDHIEPGDNHDIDNLQGVCTDCHAHKTQTEAAQARRT